MNWLLDSICFLTISGSQSYGFDTENSDFDCKGFCLPPKSIREHLFNHFDQAINNKEIENRWGYLRNPKNPKFESTVYSLQKFFQLAAQCNPNVIELLWVDNNDILQINKIGQKTIENREIFLSTKIKWTFQGYSFAQFAKIERHRKWIIKGELKKPERKDYGLQDKSLKVYGEIERIIKREIEDWNLSKFSLDELDRSAIKDTLWEIIFRTSNNKITWDNWPEKYEQAALTKFLEEFNVSKEITDLIIRETKYKNDLREYQNWMGWKEKRNLDRKNLEKDFLYDTKHATHLIRLNRMGREILEGKGVITKRPDAQELLEIRNGKWTYEELEKQFNESNIKMDELYKITKLPRSVNYEKINDLYQELLDLK
mgnify:CR=1 FL=1